jgi:membrane-associated phospholipid phosphatase
LAEPRSPKPDLFLAFDPIDLSIPDAIRSRWSLFVELINRPYPTSPPVVLPFVIFAVLVPGYLVIGAYTRGSSLHMPALALDRDWPVQPWWTLIYGSLYFAMFLPLLVLRHEEHIRRTLWAFILVWIVGSAGWLYYPTVLPRPDPTGMGEGFCAWTLKIAYSWDSPRNCFPSLHVAQPILAALTCSLVSRGLGLAVGLWAALIAISTLFTKQHYVADVIAGALLAGLAYFVFLRSYSRTAIPQLNERVVPVVILAFVGVHSLVVLGFWVAYQMK